MNFHYFDYPGLEKLSMDIDKILLKKSNLDVIHLCGFEINISGLFPFLTYLLVKSQVSDTVVLPTFELNKDIPVSTFLSNSIDGLLKGTGGDLTKKKYHGCLCQDNKLYVFYDFSNCKIRIPNAVRRNHLWFGLIDEIMNQKHICNIKVDSSVTDFFRGNLDLLFLKDDDDSTYEVPIVAYIGKEISSLGFTYVFGVTKDEQKKIRGGPFYYFTNFKNSVKQVGWNKTEKGGVVRFALFLGNMKIEQEQSHGNLEEEYISLCLYDKDNNPTFVLRDNEQQTALSYHHIDNRYLGLEFDNKREYFIS
jgi:hypothetical protein